MSGPDLKRTDPAAQLIKDAEVKPAIDHLRRTFAELTDHLRASPIDRVRTRLRGWDNYQRASLGRGETQPLVAGDIKSSFALSETGFEPRGEPGLALPNAADVPALGALDDVVRIAARLAIPAEFDEDRVIVTLFFYRVLVRAGQSYEGFLHRDLAIADAPVGSVIFYPTVKWQNIEGADLGVHLSSLPTDDLGGREPDVTFAPQEYASAAVVLGYPRNLAHGARPGTNIHPSPTDEARTQAENVREFLDPHQTTFVKDMAVFTFSQTSAIEDHIP